MRIPKRLSDWSACFVFDATESNRILGFMSDRSTRRLASRIADHWVCERSYQIVPSHRISSDRATHPVIIARSRRATGNRLDSIEQTDSRVGIRHTCRTAGRPKSETRCERCEATRCDVMRGEASSTLSVSGGLVKSRLSS